jgi:hypothetical protein
MARVWQYSLATGADLLLLLALADASDDDGLSFPDIEDLAHRARLNVEHTKAKLGQLVSQGALKKIENVGSQGNDYYQIIEVRRVR